jgi:general secretion pathway protein G
MTASVRRGRIPPAPIRARRDRRTCKRRRGFTLIEMLVVFSLLALLLSIAVPRYTATTEKAGQKARAQNMATLRDAIDKFRADQGRYPVELSELVTANYLRSVPLDPVNGTRNWIALPHPRALEPGIYDVAPPASPSELPVGSGPVDTAPKSPDLSSPMSPP